MGNWLSMSEAQILSPVLRGIYSWSTVFSESFGYATNMNKVGPFKFHDFFSVFWDLDNKFTTFFIVFNTTTAVVLIYLYFQLTN